MGSNPGHGEVFFSGLFSSSFFYPLSLTYTGIILDHKVTRSERDEERKKEANDAITPLNYFIFQPLLRATLYVFSLTTAKQSNSHRLQGLKIIRTNLISQSTVCEGRDERVGILVSLQIGLLAVRIP